MLAITPSGEASRPGPARPGKRVLAAGTGASTGSTPCPASVPGPGKVDQPVPRPDSILGLRPPVPVS